MKIKFAAALLVWGSVAGAQTPASPSAGMVNVFFAADAVAPASLDSDTNNRIDVRSAELSLFAPVDHVFEGVGSIAAELEGGRYEFSLHEAYVRSSSIIPRSRLRVGKFFIGVGRLNQIHQHDWPFTTAPKVHREFFASEAAIDTGAEYSYLLPTDRVFEITLGVTNNYCYGHCHTLGSRPPRPLVYLRPSTFFDLSEEGGLALAATILDREDAANVKTRLLGVDLAYKNRMGRRLVWLVQSELYHQAQSTPTSSSAKAGAYVYSQYGLTPAWTFGVRVDGYSHLDMKFASNNQRRADFDYGVVPVLTYKPSEFSTLRFSYSHEVDTTEGDADVRDRRFQMQLTYILGAHPAHKF